MPAQFRHDFAVLRGEAQGDIMTLWGNAKSHVDRLALASMLIGEELQTPHWYPMPTALC
jgi:hypothetical protein